MVMFYFFIFFKELQNFFWVQNLQSDLIVFSVSVVSCLHILSTVTAHYQQGIKKQRYVQEQPDQAYLPYRLSKTSFSGMINQQAGQNNPKLWMLYAFLCV